MSKKRSTDRRGPGAFETFYGELFGPRWTGLRESLLAPGSSVAFDDGLVRPYVLDPASILAAACLDVGSSDSVLDLCAAPGGKSLVLASRLGENGSLVCNERSASRRARLHRVLDEHLPEATRRLVTITGHDAARWAIYERGAYDRVLADVPCSSEQHVIQSAGALAQWSPSRTRRLAQGAYAIGCAAVDAVKPGGRVVYATCALSPLENDGVVERLLDRGRGALEAARAAATVAIEARRPETASRTAAGPPGSPTEHGWMILPDADAGLGPMYIAIIERRR